MAIISSYPTITPTSSDLVLVVDTSEDGNPTKTATIGSVNALATAPDISTAEVLVTDAQLRTLGTTRVAILPEPGSGYAYQILGLTTQSLSTGAPTSEFYDWGTQDAAFSWRRPSIALEHRVIIPNIYLPKGGGASADGMYVGTPIAGGSRDGAAIKLGVTSDINPIITPGEDPNATWTINVTYRLIQIS
jgi:hypothetical protein